jgi:hypothetical protein
MTIKKLTLISNNSCYFQVLSSCWSAESQSQFQTQFRNFEISEVPRGGSAVPAAEPPRGRSAVPAAAAAAPQSRAEQKETTTPVPILKQINE